MRVQELANSEPSCRFTHFTREPLVRAIEPME